MHPGKEEYTDDAAFLLAIWAADHRGALLGSSRSSWTLAFFPRPRQAARFRAIASESMAGEGSPSRLHLRTTRPRLALPALPCGLQAA